MRASESDIGWRPWSGYKPHLAESVEHDKGSTTTTANYLYDDFNLLEEVDNSGNVLARYTQTTNIDEPLSEFRSGTISYYQQDGIGSVSSLSSGAGVLANTYTYDSYGKTLSSSGVVANPLQYAGRELDAETGMYEYRARYYDQSVGRFVSEDPIEFDGGLNFYEYGYNEPITLNDPMGNDPTTAVLPWIAGLPEIPVGGQVVIAGATGWLAGRAIGNLQIGNGNTVDDAVQPDYRGRRRALNSSDIARRDHLRAVCQWRLY